MEQAAVQLDDGADRGVENVSVQRALRRLAHLALGARQTVRALDPVQVAVLERRAGARRDVGDDALQERPAWDPRPARQCLGEPVAGRAAGAHCVGEVGDGIDLTRSHRRQVDRCLLNPLPGRGGVPQDLRVEAGEAVGDHPRRRLERPVGRDSDVDRPAVVVVAAAGSVRRPDGGVEAQRGGLADEDRRPRALEPGQRTGVVGVHAGMDEPQLAPAPHPPQAVVGETELEHLPAVDDACLDREQLVEDAVGSFHAGKRGAEAGRPEPTPPRPVEGRPKSTVRPIAVTW
ncbi:hypothetical protein DJ010_18240 [Nocardioides silvaticus]|uniref:Uncharacterized protein n=1 Tax=Nocardioides silvaticus TaxID=2201891 RepID=A0A316TAQ1_9ACTN|nr:hypothetical protein [Nocardioides silvaticus]PWN01490.1 hypothetical protein DJ010_18240 [Nocardioides silvaticus]